MLVLWMKYILHHFRELNDADGEFLQLRDERKVMVHGRTLMSTRTEACLPDGVLSVLSIDEVVDLVSQLLTVDTSEGSLIGQCVSERLEEPTYLCLGVIFLSQHRLQYFLLECVEIDEVELLGVFVDMAEDLSEDVGSLEDFAAKGSWLYGAHVVALVATMVVRRSAQPSHLMLVVGGRDRRRQDLLSRILTAPVPRS